jgi:hypothetical protein
MRPIKGFWLIGSLILWILLTALAPSPYRAGMRDPGVSVSFFRSQTIEDTSSKTVGLEEFRNSLAYTGNAKQPIGVFVKDVMAFPIVEQPRNNPAFVSEEEDKITHFSLAERYGTIGLLAHNDRAGVTFFELQTGDVIWIIFGNGTMKRFRVSAVERYQALSPTSPYSTFVNLDDPTRKRLSASELFLRIYQQPGNLVLQTCIAQGNEPSWGRLFVIAEPDSPEVAQP